MHIQHKDDGSRGKFFVREEGQEATAEMFYHYTSNPSTIIIDHTAVDEIHKGKGVGGQLVHAAVEWARSNNIKIIPVCSFAKAVFDKKEEYADVLA